MKKNQEQPRYLTFPIALLKNSVNDIKVTITDCITYCIYSEYQKLCSREGFDPSDVFDSDDYKFAEAIEIVGVNFMNPDFAYERGQGLHYLYPSNLPKTSISFHKMMDFYKNYKSEFEVHCFMAYAGLRSIVQRKPYAKIGDAYFLARMAGNSKVEEPLPDWVLKYAQSRYHLNKIKKELQSEAWALKYYARQLRGFYFSFSMDLKDLAVQAEKKRKSRQDEQRKQLSQEAYEYAMQQLNKG